MAADIDALRKILTGADRLLIVTHDNPDPDALTSAFALAKVAGAMVPGIHYRIVCDGIVGRAENRALKRELKIKLSAAARISWARWPLVALVDTQPGTGNNCLPPKRSADIVIDHHPLRKKTKACYLDVRPDVGACATLLMDYLIATSTPVGDKLAAGLCYAIASETQDLAREASECDTAAYAALFPKADKRMLGRVLHPSLKHSYYSILSHALLSAFTYGNVIGSHLGDIDHPDSVSLVADLLLRHERLTWSIVTGVYKNALYVSLRTMNQSAHAGELLRKMMRSAGLAGGHDRMAGGRIPLKGMDAAQRRQLKDDIVQRLIGEVRRRKDVQLKPLISPEELDRIFRLAGRPQPAVDSAKTQP